MYKKYYLINTIGNPLDTTLGLVHLIYGGVFEKYPKLKVLAADGGYFPYQPGRFNHGFDVIKEVKRNIDKKPDHYLDNFF
jgi:aminocarboxymuconate-semialdehyde decarboxylase